MASSRDGGAGAAPPSDEAGGKPARGVCKDPGSLQMARCMVDRTSSTTARNALEPSPEAAGPGRSTVRASPPATASAAPPAGMYASVATAPATPPAPALSGRRTSAAASSGRDAHQLAVAPDPLPPLVALSTAAAAVAAAAVVVDAAAASHGAHAVVPSSASTPRDRSCSPVLAMVHAPAPPLAPQAGHSGRLPRSLTTRKRASAASTERSFPLRVEAGSAPATTLSASIAWREPMVLVTGPSTPLSSQEPTVPRGGGDGCRQR
mmetsp:Transcript_26536/g.99854  ORF Transcript_26536/g.99854 Transcript_26536/m.99854 type:complete len:264 (+) Transcript_26536:346-1137(+)